MQWMHLISPCNLMGPWELPWRIHGEKLDLIPGKGKLRAGPPPRQSKGCGFCMGREEVPRHTSKEVSWAITHQGMAREIIATSGFRVLPTP